MFVPVYKWTWSFDDNATETQIYPYVATDMKKEYARESGCMFFRPKLNGEIKLFNADFDTLEAMPIDTKVCINLYISYDKAQTWELYHRAFFYKTDATWNYDDKIVSTNLTTNDEYTKILDNYDKEKNLIELAPNIETLTYRKRSCMQIYYTNSEFSGNFIDTIYWESPSEIMEAADVIQYGFSYITSCAKMTITGWDDAHNGDYYSWYNKETESAVPMPYLIFKGVFKKVVPNYQFGLGYDNGYWLSYQGVKICQLGSGQPSSFEMNLSSIDVPIPVGAKAKFEICFIVGRVLTDVNTGVAVQDGDPIGAGNYKYIYRPVSVLPPIELSITTSANATEYGKRSDGRYWVRPNLQDIPIARTSWSWVSVWCNIWNLDSRLIHNKTMTLRDAYTLDSCINVLLKEADSTLSFQPTSAYSQFLYGTTTIRRDEFHLFLTQKTNILVADYDKPAQKAMTTLKQLLDMLANTFRLFWFVEGGKLRIEHEYFFLNGGSYYTIPEIAVDLTQQRNRKNDKPYDFGQNTIKFNKSQMPEQYQFRWMDDATEAFNGLPIVIKSNYAQKGLIENVNVTNFSADIDYAMVNSENISNDGFFLLCAVEGEVPIVTREVKNISYRLQNGYCAFCDLQPNYWLYNMPAKKLVVNGNNTDAIMVARNKEQQVKFPAMNDVDVNKLIKTNVGNGNVNKITIDLESRTATATINFETE